MECNLLAKDRQSNLTIKWSSIGWTKNQQSQRNAVQSHQEYVDYSEF